MLDLGGIGYWVMKRAELSADKVALIFQGETLTYAELNRRVNRLAHSLMSLGVRRGDRVAVLLFNCPQFIEIVFACAKIGAIVVPINYRLSPPEVKFILHDSGSHLVIYHTALSALLAPIIDETEVIHRISIPFPPPGFSTAAADQLSSHDYEEMLQSMAETEPALPVSEHDPHLMMYTSGTTGYPKGALLTHRNTTWNAIHSFLNKDALQADDVVLTVAPLFHIGGLSVHTLPALYKGATVVLLPHFDPVAVLETIQTYQVNVLFLVPAMWQAIMAVPDFEKYNLSSLRDLVSGGAPCPLTVIQFFQERGFKFLEGFGMTETAPGVMILTSEDAVRKHGSVGRPLMHVKARIVDDEDRDVPPGEVGELVLQGPNICAGYWHRPEANEEAFRGGWFHTGDLARQDEEGYFYIVDRKKDMLISGGENIYSPEVEQVLFRHPKVADAAVIGVPDEKWGEVPAAIVVLKPGAGTLTLEELAAHCEGQLARYKIPKILRIVDELPRNATGKVLKRQLREQFKTG